MRRWVWRVLLAALVLAALTGTALAADPVTLDNGVVLELDTTSNEWIVTGYDKTAGDVAKTGEIEIPAHYKNLLVTAIKENAFKADTNNNFGRILKTVIIPGTLKTVGPSAFKDCKSLETVTFLDYVVGKKVERNTIIGANAFENCTALVNLTLSCNIEKIEMQAFKGCSRLENLIIPKLVDEIRPGAFAGCTHLEDVTFLDVDTKFYFGTNLCAFPIGDEFPKIIHCMENSSAYKNTVSLLGKDKADKEVVHFITNVTDIKSAVTKEATCTSKGQIKISFTCPVVTKEVPVTNSPSARDDTGGTGGGDTPAPPTTQPVKVPCSYYTKENDKVAANVTIDKNGNATYSITHDTSIIPHAEIAIPATAPCIDEPFGAGVKCANCSAILKAPEPLAEADKKPHTFAADDKGEEVIIKEATCTEAGKSGVAKVCTVCQQKVSDPTQEKSVAATGHQYYGEDGNPLPGKQEMIRTATCTEKGIKVTYSVCTVCGEELTCSNCAGLVKNITDAKDANTLNTAIEAYTKHLKGSHDELKKVGNEIYFPATFEVLPELGHTKPASVKSTVKKAPTCTEDGVEEWPLYQCAVCKEWVDGGTGVIPKLGGEHKWTETETKTEPTCTGEGISVPKCSICGALDDDPTKEGKIPALGHEVDEKAETTKIIEGEDKTWPATCTKEGQTTLTGVCIRSDELHGTDPRENVTVIKKIKMLPHTPETPVEEIPATCTTPGKKITHPTKCKVCGTVISGEEKEEIIDAKGHTWGEFDPDGGPEAMKPNETCESKDVTGKVKCTVCGVEEEHTLTIEGLGKHTWGEWKASEDGKTETRTCSVCKKTETRDVNAPEPPDDPDDPNEPDDPDKPDKPTEPDTPKSYSITVVPGAGGAASASRSTAQSGDTVTLTISASSGYELDMIRAIRGGVSVVSLTDLGGGQYRFTMPADNVEIRVTFSKKNSSSGTPWASAPGEGASSTDPRRTTDVMPTQNPTQSVPRAGAYEQLFQDIPTNHWAAGEINWANQMGYMNGTAGRFNPDGNITHQQMWMVLARLTGNHPANMTEARRWAVEHSFADGSSPTGAVSRHQLVTALYRCAHLMGSANRNTTSLAGYPDSRTVPTVARDAFSWAVANGILGGTANGRLDPNGTLTRAQFAVILYRYSQRI